jgi:hypothetical protein
VARQAPAQVKLRHLALVSVDLASDQIAHHGGGKMLFDQPVEPSPVERYPVGPSPVERYPVNLARLPTLLTP